MENGKYNVGIRLVLMLSLFVTDVDECFERFQMIVTLMLAVINTVGSYRCVCSNGYIGNGIDCCKLIWCSFSYILCPFVSNLFQTDQTRV